MKRYQLLAVAGLLLFTASSKGSWGAWDSVYVHDNDKLIKFIGVAKPPHKIKQYVVLHLDLPIYPGAEVRVKDLRDFARAPAGDDNVEAAKFLCWCETGAGGPKIRGLKTLSEAVLDPNAKGDILHWRFAVHKGEDPNNTTRMRVPIFEVRLTIDVTNAWEKTRTALQKVCSDKCATDDDFRQAFACLILYLNEQPTRAEHQLAISMFYQIFQFTTLPIATDCRP